MAGKGVGTFLGHPRVNVERQLLFVVLAYNEERNVARLLDSICALRLDGFQPSLLLVNDGSTDRTREVILGYADRLPVTVVDHPTNLGVGQGFRTGFAAALARLSDDDVIVTIEADNTSDLGILPAMLQQLAAGGEVSLASCYAPGGGVKGTTMTRVFLSKIANGIIRWFCGVSEVHTYSSFYRAYRVRALRAVVQQYGERFIEEPGFVCMVEVVVKLHRCRIRMTEVPMILDGAQRKGASKMKIVRTIAGYARFAWRNLFHDHAR